MRTGRNDAERMVAQQQVAWGLLEDTLLKQFARLPSGRAATWLGKATLILSAKLTSEAPGRAREP